MKILAKLEKRIDVWFLLIASFLFFLLRFPSLFEPYWYGDEGIYEVIGQAIRAGRLLYAGIWDNKPPMLYIFYALFASSQFGIRLVSLLFGIGAMIVFFYLSKKLFLSQRISMITTSVFALLFALPVLEGNIANAENFMLLPIILAALLICTQQFKNKSEKFSILLSAGFLVGIAFLFKIVAIFDFSAFFIFLFFLSIPEKLSFSDIKRHGFTYLLSFIARVLPFVLGFFLPILITVLFFVAKGAFSDFFRATFSSNVGYVGYGNNFLFPQGLLVLKLIALSGFVLFLFYRRSALSKGTIFILLWSAFSLFNLFFSQRPYTHYMLVFLPCFSLSVGFLFLRQRMRLILIFILIIVVWLIATHFDFYGNKKAVMYYQNFVSFVTGQKSTEKYQAFFDQKTPRDYEIASYLKLYTHPLETIFIWGNSAQIYVLSDTLPVGRYTVAYHISDQKSRAETANDLMTKKAKYIVLLPDVGPFPFSLSGYTLKTILSGSTIYERIY